MPSKASTTRVRRQLCICLSQSFHLIFGLLFGSSSFGGRRYLWTDTQNIQLLIKLSIRLQTEVIPSREAVLYSVGLDAPLKGVFVCKTKKKTISISSLSLESKVTSVVNCSAVLLFWLWLWVTFCLLFWSLNLYAFDVFIWHQRRQNQKTSEGIKDLIITYIVLSAILLFLFIAKTTTKTTHCLDQIVRQPEDDNKSNWFSGTVVFKTAEKLSKNWNSSQLLVKTFCQSLDCVIQRVFCQIKRKNTLNLNQN